MRYLILGLILANLVIYYIIFDGILTKNLVGFLSVGQGSAVLIKDKKNTFLYDTGRNPYLLFKELDRFLPFYQRKIDILFLSHPDIDHYLATFELLKRYKVRSIILTNLKTDDPNYLKLLEEIKKRNIPIIFLQRGDQVKTKKFNFLILHPDKIYEKENDSSLVIKVLGKYSYLLTGDIEKEAIQSLIFCCSKILKTNYFLVPHHGSKYSLDENFYNFLQANLTIIQVGKNFYGHPHKEVLDFLNKKRIKIWRTDRDGTLVIFE